jgi:hypothetical protein
MHDMRRRMPDNGWGPDSPIIVISHRRSGTHWTLDALRHNFRGVDPTPLVLDRVLPWHPQHLPLEQFEEQIRDGAGIRLIKTHVPPTLAPFRVDRSVDRFTRSLLSESNRVYVYRDGRDVLVSLYLYMQHFDETVSAATFSEFVRMENQFDVIPGQETTYNRVQYWKAHVTGWLDDPGTVSVAYEQLHESYESTIARIGRVLDLATSGPVKLVSPPSTWIGKLAIRVARKLGIETRTSAILPHRGTTGTWKRYFSEGDIEFFNRHAGRLLRELGYR